MPSQLKSDHLFYWTIPLVIFPPLFFFPSLINLYRLPKTVLISFLVTVLLWLWFFLLVQEKEKEARFPLAIPMILYLCISMLSLIKGTNPIEGIFALSREVIYISLFWIVVNHIRTQEQIEKILLWAIPSAVIVSLIGIYQKFGGDIPGLANISTPGSTFGNKNIGAQYILLLLPVPYLFLISTTDRQKERLFAICASITTTYLLYTGTRAAWAGCIVASLAILFFLRLKRTSMGSQIANFKGQIWKKKTLLGCIVLFVLAMNLIPPYVVPRWNVVGFTSPFTRFGTALELDQDISFLNRLAMWANTLEMFKDHPLLGVGKGNFKIIYPLYAAKGIKDVFFSAKTKPQEAHNDYIQLLGETGILGFLSFLVILILIGLKVWKSFPGIKNSHWTNLVLTLSFSFIALLIVASLDFPFELPVSESFFWLLAALLWVSCEYNRRSSESLSSVDGGWLPSPRWSRAFVGFLSVLSILIAATHLTFLRAEFYSSRGTTWFYEVREGPWQPAETDLKKAEYLNPIAYRYPYRLGLFYIWREKYKKAIEANLRTLNHHPNYINAYNNLGVAYASAGKIEEAELAWEKALEIWPDHNEARNNLATVYAVRGKKQEAIALFKESLIRNPQDKEARQKLETLLGKASQTPKP